MQDHKYIVFNRNTFYELMGELGLPHTGDCAPAAAHIIDRAEEEKIEDAVVIRLQDQFAGPALHAYSSAIQSSVETLEGIKNLPQEAVKALHTMRQARDHFMEAALEADAHQAKKVPD